MFPIPKEMCLNIFVTQRCLSGRDLYRHLGERLPKDRGFISSRNPATRQDEAMQMIYDGYSKLSEIENLPSDIPPAFDPSEELG